MTATLLKVVAPDGASQLSLDEEDPHALPRWCWYVERQLTEAELRPAILNALLQLAWDSLGDPQAPFSTLSLGIGVKGQQ